MKSHQRINADLRNGTVAVFAILKQMESSEFCPALPRVIRLQRCAKIFGEPIELSAVDGEQVHQHPVDPFENGGYIYYICLRTRTKPVANE